MQWFYLGNGVCKMEHVHCFGAKLHEMGLLALFENLVMRTDIVGIILGLGYMKRGFLRQPTPIPMQNHTHMQGHRLSTGKGQGFCKTHGN